MTPAERYNEQVIRAAFPAGPHRDRAIARATATFARGKTSLNKAIEEARAHYEIAPPVTEVEDADATT